MKTRTLLYLVMLLVSLPFLLCAQKDEGKKASLVEIQYQKFVLDNGLTLLIHEDHKAPIAAVNIWYHVASKNEKPGRTGFAHLFEHLMFNGSENYNDDYFQALERLGATDLNGTTNEDRTNYFQNVPTSALDRVLWLESDRMGHLLGAIDQKKLDEQRGVVQNEKRQGENEPYAISEELITKSTYPAGHPYSWTVIGSLEDLNAASLDDVKDWFRKYYGPSNATLAIAGDISAKAVVEKVKKYFGDIPSGPPIARHETWVAKRTGTQRQFAYDRVPQARIYKIWNTPEWGSTTSTRLRLVASVLASGKTSRLYKRLVYDDQIATNVRAYIDEREIGSQFHVEATAKPGGDLAQVERAIDEELDKFLKSGPTDQELQRVKSQALARFIRGSERIGGFGGKSDILAQNQVYTGSADHYKVFQNDISTATTGDLWAVAKDWLSDGVYILEIQPFPQFASTKADTTLRKVMPAVDAPPEGKFPNFQKATLSNGMKVILVERRSIPDVSFTMCFDAGFAADQFAAPGTANLAMSTMDAGTKTRTALQISEDLLKLGSTMGAGSNLDASFVSLSSLVANLDASLAIYADVVMNPVFPKDDVGRIQKQMVALIKREKVQPIQMAVRVFPKLLYGKGHAYANPLTGTGTEESVAKMTREDMVTFHQTWIRPNNATLIIVGATTLNEIKPKLENLFKGWKAGDIPKKNISAVALPPKQRVFIIDKPDAQQSIIFAGNVAPPKSDPHDIAIDVMNTILGGAFTSRLNMNLREDKHWSYGAGSFVQSAKGQSPFIAYGPVQTDKTKESMVEINKELRDILSARPPTADELEKTQKNLILSLPGSWETNGAVGGSITQMVQYGLPDEYWTTYAKKIRSIDLAAITEAAKLVIHPDNLVWVVVGDRSKIEAGVRSLNYGELQFLDSDGNPVK